MILIFMKKKSKKNRLIIIIIINNNIKKLIIFNINFLYFIKKNLNLKIILIKKYKFIKKINI